MAISEDRTQAAVVVEFGQRSSKSRCSFTAAIPLGSVLRPVAKSPTVDGAMPVSSAISGYDSPASSRRALTLDDHGVSELLMPPMLRPAVDTSQRVAVGAVGCNMDMRPADLPKLASIGHRVRHWREKRSLSRAALAKMVGVSPSTLSDLELDRTAEPYNLHMYARALGVHVDYLKTDRWIDPGAEGAMSAREQSFPLNVDVSRLERLNSIERQLIELTINLKLDEIEAARPRSRNRNTTK